MAKPGPKPMPAEERFAKYVQKRGIDECWLWAGTRERVGYGQFWHEGRNIKAHRFAWVLVHGEPPRFHWVVQTCGNRLCVNPKHLGLITPQAKSAQMHAGKPQISLEERFWSKVNKDGPLWKGTPCWVWTAAKDGHGYGQFVLNGKKALSHRVAWEMANGSIPDGLEVLHLCDNPPCVRPDHLRPDTHKANLQDAARKGRAGRKKSS